MAAYSFPSSVGKGTEEMAGAGAGLGEEGRGSRLLQEESERVEATAGKGEAEEIELIEAGDSRPSAEKKPKSQTVFLKDGKRRIDFILAYVKDEKKEDRQSAFLESCKGLGLELETEHCSESPDQKTYFVKVHATHEVLLRGAEELLLRLPLEINQLHKSGWSEDCCSSPFNPTIPEGLEVEHFFTAPFSYKHRQRFIGWDDEEKFFTTAQRSAIVWHILQKAKYGDHQDDLGILRLLSDKTFTAAFPLHESSYKVQEGEEVKTDRQLLYQQWAHPLKWYKNQPLDHIRRYFGEKVAIYFAWLGFYTTMITIAALLGVLVTLYGVITIPSSHEASGSRFDIIPSFLNPPAADICEEQTRTDYVMCPLCDKRCGFWYLTDTCRFAHVALFFDNEATVVFAILMSLWSVLFLEFWKRKQFHLQFKWDMLGYEIAEEQARPEFEQKIKKHVDLALSKNKTKTANRFLIHNPVLDRDEYIQPAHWFLPKIVVGMSLLLTVVLVALAVVFGVILYRLATAGAIYRLVAGVTGGPSVADIVVSVSGAIIQLICILILNKMYSYLAKWLTDWELHRTKTDYEDAYTAKMYLFQFVNFYTSIFYIAFFKGNFVGYPGDYQRLGGLRLDDCSSYGCLLELTIQLAIIMVGKQILNNCQELAIPYVKRLWNWCRKKEETDEDVYTRWEKDFDLVDPGDQPLFQEYLELVIQYGFVTIFVAAFPLAPLFALLNNWVEIRLDAHKFISVFRRPIAERAQDIGAWYTILEVVSKLAVITNALLIGFTSQFVPFRVYIFGDYGGDQHDLIRGSLYDNDTDLLPLVGYVNWSLSEFPIDVLLDGNAFPAYTAQELPYYDDDGEEITGTDGSPLLYLPWINFHCILRTLTANEVTTMNFVTKGTCQNVTSFTEMQYQSFYENETLRGLVFDVMHRSDSPRRAEVGECFQGQNVSCRFRGHVDEDGSRPLEFWQVLAVRVILVTLFEHLVFIAAGAIAWLIPDVPQSVRNEIKREKLLAYQALHTAGDGNSEKTSGKIAAEPLEFDAM